MGIYWVWLMEIDTYPEIVKQMYRLLLLLAIVIPLVTIPFFDL